MKAVAQRVFGYAGLQVTRSRYRHRFDGMSDALALLRAAGFRPRVVVDGGANVGAWTTKARLNFPDAAFHLIEPLPGCAAALEGVAGPGDRIHQVALVGPGVSRVRMIGAGAEGTATGASVSTAAADDGVDVKATTLDDLLLDAVGNDDRALLKLDLEGHELEALRGGTALLARVEVLISEVQFFPVDGNNRPVFADVLRAAEQAGFTMYDIASMSPRPRDGRLRMGDVVFVSNRSPLLQDVAWA